MECDGWTDRQMDGQMDEKSDIEVDDPTKKGEKHGA